MTTKMKATLERTVLSSTNPTEKMEKLAMDAQLILGYTRLANRVVPPQRLGQILLQLEIEPYSKASVERYKKEQLNEVRAKLKTEPHRRNRYGIRIYKTAMWKLIPISKYEKTIPAFVLRKALQIKQACPSAEISVESLVVKQQVRNLDPFLTASLGGESYYIEVWDETKFENTLL